jgi:XTP/dITP diphosphohydrolase
MKFVVASSNAGKLAEFRDLLGEAGYEFVTQGELGVSDAEETGLTFVENALLKARHAARVTGLPALADDSGLCVDALGGAPGVASAHFATLAQADEGDEDREALRRRQDAANNALLLERLREVGERRARFVSTLVALRSADDPEPLIASGRWEAEVLRAPRGAGGFGYDPLVFIPALGASVAELDAATKNAASHRALAAAQMLDLMRHAWRLG